jgi:hypothetical protein
VQEILRTSRTSRCTEKSGWFVFGTDDRIRDLLTELINEQISKERETERSAQSDEVLPYFTLYILISYLKGTGSRDRIQIF